MLPAGFLTREKHHSTLARVSYRQPGFPNPAYATLPPGFS